MNLVECYKILQVPSDSDLETIKKAYRKRAFELHPDLHPNDADASRRFQELNEAYVVISQHTESMQGSGKTYTDAKKKFDEKQKESWGNSSWKPSWGSASSSNTAGQQQAKEKAKASQQYSSYKTAQKEVLQDILKDPFARRVFEDIYSEIRKGQSGTGARSASGGTTASTTTTSKKVSVGWDKKAEPGSKSGGVSGWLKRQLDDEKVIYLPPENLISGTRLRLQIQIGLKKALKVVEVTIPKDYIVGKSIRLKGLGRSIGSWKGDLYLKLFAKV